MSAEVAADLVHGAHLTVRDAGRVLGVSHQRTRHSKTASRSRRQHTRTVRGVRGIPRRLSGSLLDKPASASVRRVLSAIFLAMSKVLITLLSAAVLASACTAAILAGSVDTTTLTNGGAVHVQRQAPSSDSSDVSDLGRANPIVQHGKAGRPSQPPAGQNTMPPSTNNPPDRGHCAMTLPSRNGKPAPNMPECLTY